MGKLAQTLLRSTDLSIAYILCCKIVGGNQYITKNRKVENILNSLKSKPFNRLCFTTDVAMKRSEYEAPACRNEMKLNRSTNHQYSTYSLCFIACVSCCCGQ